MQPYHLPATPAEDIVKRFSLESIPENVKRLGHLVSRPDATIDDVAKLICSDKEFTMRLLRAVNPRAASMEDYTCATVEAALKRCGMGSVLLVAMHDPLLCAVQKTFHTMLGTDLQIQPVAGLIQGEHVLCELNFVGKATGAACLRMTSPTALLVAARMLGRPHAGEEDPAVIDDVIGELSNIVVGNFKSNLCDVGLNCKLSLPVITRTSDFMLRSVSGILAERIGLHAPDLDLFVDLNVNPWGE